MSNLSAVESIFFAALGKGTPEEQAALASLVQLGDAGASQLR